MNTPLITVIGSSNMDLVVQTGRFPGPGETVIGGDFVMNPGGKGANQAAACGRLGADVRLFGAVGRDHFSTKLLASLKESRVIVADLLMCEDTPTGMAQIWVDSGGENAIAIVAGANAKVDHEYVASTISKIREASWLLLQLETPLDPVADLLEQLTPESPKAILDPAPARPLERFPTERLWLITPNEHELGSLTGLPTATETEIEKACRRLLTVTRAAAVLCKAGVRGAYLDTGDGFRHFPGYSVGAVDTTAAGDAFNGALAVALDEGRSLEEAIDFANAAGALSVTKAGAQQSLPWRRELETFQRSALRSQRRR
jgi:ribokinase